MPRATEEAVGTPGRVLRALLERPGELLLRRWNWKSALWSALFRANLFLAANATAGKRAALAAALTELCFRLTTAGFYGAITQAFRRAQPAWLAAATVAVLLPAISHSLEFLVHKLRGTANLRVGLVASIVFTAVSTVFNWYAMRHGAMLVGEGATSLGDDLRLFPRLIARAVQSAFSRRTVA